MPLALAIPLNGDIPKAKTHRDMLENHHQHHAAFAKRQNGFIVLTGQQPRTSCVGLSVKRQQRIIARSALPALTANPVIPT